MTLKCPSEIGNLEATQSTMAASSLPNILSRLCKVFDWEMEMEAKDMALGGEMDMEET